MTDTIPPSEWKRRRKRMDLSILGCWTVVIGSFIAGLCGVDNPVINNIWMPALAGALGLVVNYQWAATKDDGNRMAALAELLKPKG